MLPDVRWPNGRIGLVIALLSGAATAQGAIAAARQESGVLVAAGRHAEAMAVWQRTLAEAQAASDSPTAAVCEFELGVLLRNRWQLAAALPHFERALVALEAHGGEARDGVGFAQCLDNIARIHKLRARYDLALPKSESALAAHRRTIAADDDYAVRLLHNVGLCLVALARYEEALAKHQEALAVSMRRHPGDHPDTAAGLDYVARCLTRLGRYEQALPEHERAAAMTRRVHAGDHRDVMLCCSGLGDCLSELGRFAEALPVFASVAAMAERLHAGDHDDVVRALLNLAVCLKNLARFEEAKVKFDAALTMSMRLNQGAHPTTVLCLHRSANCLVALGQDSVALDRYERAAAMAQQIYSPGHPTIATCLQSLGDHLCKLGRVAEGLPKLEVALAMQQRHHAGDNPEVAIALQRVADGFLAIGRSAEALAAAEAALAMQQRLAPASREIARDMAMVTRCSLVRGRFEPALALAEGALAQHRRIYPNGHASDAYYLGLVADCQVQLGRTEQALRTAQDALAVARRHHPAEGREVAVSTLNVGRLLFASGRSGEAVASTTAAVDALRRTHGTHPHRDLVEGLSILAQMRLAAGDVATSVELLDEAITGIEALRLSARALLGEDRARYFGDLKRWDPYGQMRRAQARLGRPDRALAYAERGRGRSLLDLLAGGQFDALAEAERLAREEGNHAGVRRAQQVRADLEAADARVGRIQQGLAGLAADRTVEDDARAAQEARLRSALHAADEARRGAARARARVVAGVEAIGTPASNQELQAALTAGELLLLWALDDQESHLLVVPPAGPIDLVAIAATHGSTRQAVASLREEMVGAAERRTSEPNAEHQPVDARAFARTVLPDAVWQRVRRARRIFAVPDGALHRLPLETLYIGERDGEPRRWIDDGPPVAYVASGSVLRWLRRRDEARRDTVAEWDLLAVGDPAFPATAAARHTGRGAPLDGGTRGSQSRADHVLSLSRNGGRGPFDELRPLPRTRDEVESIAREVRRASGAARARVLLGADATEAAVSAAAGKARYLHIATHGLADESETASFSALALATPQAVSAIDDGFLTVSDLLTRWGQRLPACKMVVLSACRTHVGPQIRDEAPHALPIGFLYAGASSVVATQWMVADESTARLMADFYARIRAQTGRADRLQALAEAKKALRAESPNPYYWAPFVYIGSPE